MRILIAEDDPHLCAHDGCITVESEVGMGTTFTVVFPIAAQTSA